MAASRDEAAGCTVRRGRTAIARISAIDSQNRPILNWIRQRLRYPLIFNPLMSREFAFTLIAQRTEQNSLDFLPAASMLPCTAFIIDDGEPQFILYHAVILQFGITSFIFL